LKGLGLAALGPLVLASSDCTTVGTPDTGTATTCSGGLCIDLADATNAALAATNGSLLIDAPSDTLIVIRKSSTTVVALSAVCTHAGCLVGFQQSSQTVYCNCHGSEFAEDGHVLGGPARRALRVYSATLADPLITIAI